jgi:hypothetical protein
MKRKVGLSLIVVVLAVMAAVPAFARGNVPHDVNVVFVRSQGLYYDTIVLGDLPQKGRFQILEVGAMGLETDFGPGDQGYVGGRWWLDKNGNGEMDAGELFLCPLLGPGRETP